MMVSKASLFKRAIFTQEVPEIQLGLKIEDNNDAIDIYKQIHALIPN